MVQTTTETLAPTAARIIATARQLFMQRGYRAVSISDIVSAAEITKPTLYYHFADKEDLFAQIVLHMLADMRARLEHTLETAPDIGSKLTALVRMLMDEPDMDSRMVRQETREHLSHEQQARIAEAFHRHMFEPIRDVMSYGIARGEMGGQSADELTMLFLCVLEGFHFQNSQRQESRDLATTQPQMNITFSPERIVQMFLNGVGTRTHE